LNIASFLKFASNYSFTQWKLEVELMHCQIYINLGDFSSAMILITKTLASLEEQNNGNFGHLRLEA
jgi:hypothetical protein